MRGAIDASDLEGVWARYLPTEDLYNFARSRLYVPALSSAARRLIALGRVGVASRDSALDEFTELAKSDALKVVSNVDNWGTVDDVNPAVSGHRNATESLPHAVTYSLYLIDRDQLIENFREPPPMDYVEARDDLPGAE